MCREHILYYLWIIIDASTKFMEVNIRERRREHILYHLWIIREASTEFMAAHAMFTA